MPGRTSLQRGRGPAPEAPVPGAEAVLQPPARVPGPQGVLGEQAREGGEEGGLRQALGQEALSKWRAKSLQASRGALRKAREKSRSTESLQAVGGGLEVDGAARAQEVLEEGVQAHVEAQVLS